VTDTRVGEKVPALAATTCVSANEEGSTHKLGDHNNTCWPSKTPINIHFSP